MTSRLVSTARSLLWPLVPFLVRPTLVEPLHLSNRSPCDVFRPNRVFSAPFSTHLPRLFRSSPHLSQTYQTTLQPTFDAQESTIVVNVPEPETTPTVTLRSYQHLAIESCLAALRSGTRRIGVSSPTGSGKTTMFMHLIPRVPYPLPPRVGRDNEGETSRAEVDRIKEEDEGHGGSVEIGTREGEVVDTSVYVGRTLILVGSVELANQAERAARTILGSGFSVEVEQSKRVASGLADVTIATYQTLNNVDRLGKFDPSLFKLVIVDEAHHAAAPSYMKLLHYFNDDVKLPESIEPHSTRGHGYKVPIIGFSATFSRHDQLALSAVFEEIVFHRDLQVMLSEGWLAPAKSTSVYCELGLDDVELNRQGDYKTASLANHVNTPEINDLVVRTYLHRAGTRRSTLVFCVDLTHVDNLVETFRQAGVDARSVSSLSHRLTRKRTIEEFGRGEFPVLVNCEVLTEGTDIPQIDCIVLARPTRSNNLLMQMVGRGLRTSPDTGKVDCHIIDIVDNISRSSGMVTVPTLLGLLYDEMDNGEVREKTADARDEPATTQTHCETKHGLASDYDVTYIDSSDPFRVASNFTGHTLAQMSGNAWVACGKDRFVLELMSTGFVTVSVEKNGTWTISFTMKLLQEMRGRSPYAARRVVGTAESLERALQGADRFAERRLGRELVKQISRFASWRRRPATDKQIALLLKMKGITNTSSDSEPGENIDSTSRTGGEVAQRRKVVVLGKEVEVDELTAGQVAAYLCAAQHGAFTVRNKADRAAKRVTAKEIAKREKDRLADERNLRLPPSV